MNYRILIFLVSAQNFVIRQTTVKLDQFCIPPPVTREIVSGDTLPMHHSFCVLIVKWDKNNKIVASSTLCDTSIGDTGFLFDTSIIGTQDDYYNDTSGKIIFETVSKNGVILECYSYYYGKSTRVEYKEGYVSGQPIRFSYEYDEYGNYSKMTTTTSKEIKVIDYTRRTRDNFGNYLPEVTIIPRNQSKN